VFHKGTIAFFAGEGNRTQDDPDNQIPDDVSPTMATIYEINVKDNFTVYDIVKFRHERTINVGSLAINNNDAYFGTTKFWDPRNIAIYKVYLPGQGVRFAKHKHKNTIDPKNDIFKKKG
jgi:hypothetical protein